MGAPCPNNPDVREYLLALYGDLVKNYDVDFVQTCMLSPLMDIQGIIFVSANRARKKLMLWDSIWLQQYHY